MNQIPATHGFNFHYNYLDGVSSTGGSWLDSSVYNFDFSGQYLSR
ncbi:hypothetical protein [Salinivirga cyanobacteriivorans]|nr:hypothetical protein [Salinivirga cyanobacteriivorans]